MPKFVRSNISIPEDFVFGEVSPKPTRVAISSPPSLGPIAAFAGAFAGSGFNTIFRPNNPITPTILPIPVSSDNILELNLTSESLVFSPSLGSVPNRGEIQADIFLNGVPYLQTIQDVTNPAQPVGIHVEPGIWMVVPSTTNPQVPDSLVRMASIPHGTTINAQGIATSFSGPPNIPPASITPFPIGGGAPINFPSQTATAVGTARIPQDLTPFIATGAITQAILDDPNTVLRNVIERQNIISTVQIDISTSPAQPLFGGGSADIAFLLGDPSANNPNANAIQMQATFWIETVMEKIVVPIFRPGQPPLTVRGTTHLPGQPVPRFSITPPFEEIREPRIIEVLFTQIQYSQLVLLNFNGLSWPHVSVATLVPSDQVQVPSEGWD
jgi:hypothetical protein